MNIKKWINELPKQGKAMPVLSFPSVSLLGISVYDITHNAEYQVKGMKAVADKIDAAASVSMMDLSVEAEAFGCKVVADENEIPTIIGELITDEDEARALEVPEVGAGRTGIYLEAAKSASSIISDRPVFAGMIGPYSLVGRLNGVSEALLNCIIEPDFMTVALEKATEFLIKYAKAYKDAGVAGILMAEPLSGLLSPALERDFSYPYVKKIIDEVQDDSFCVIYHNCGPNVLEMTESIYANGAAAYHFGDAIKLEDILKKMPTDRPVLGNISPSEQFMNGSPSSIYDATIKLLEDCSKYENFVLSSGCDIPPASSWDNIDSFFKAARDFRVK